MDARGDQRDVQSDGCNLVPELQVFVYDLVMGKAGSYLKQLKANWRD
jgi:hypothetical protein